MECLCFTHGSKASEFISDFQEENGKAIQDKFRHTFDTELKSMLGKKEFCESLSDFMDSYTNLKPY